MRIENIAIIVIGIVSLIVSFYTFTRGKNKSASRLYSIIIFFAGPLWSLSIALFRESRTVSEALFWDRLIYLVAILIPALTFAFSKLFPKRKKIGLLLLTILTTGSLFLLYQLFFTKNFIHSVILNDNGNSITIGYSYTLWLVWFCSLMPIAVFSMFNEYRKLTGPAKEQAKYIVIGTAFPILGTAPTNAILPYFGIYEYIWVGPFFLLIMNSIIAYGLTRTRFISKKTILRAFIRNFIFGLILYFSFFSFAKITILYTGNLFTRNSYLLGILITFFATPFFLQMIDFIESLISKTLLNEGTDPIHIRDDFLKKISTELNLNAIASLYTETIHKIFNIQETGVVVLDADKSSISFKLSNSLKLPEIKDLQTLSEYFVDENNIEEIIILDEELFLISEDENYSISNEKTEVLNVMKNNGLHIIVPIQKKAQYFGLFLIGESNDKKILKVEELSLLISISNSASVAIGRALLHKEVESFNKTLRQKVDNATVKLQEKNDQLQKLYNDLEQLYQKEKDLMDVAGHEIRTPSSIIKTNLAMLETHLKDNYPKSIDTKTKTYLKRLVDSTERQIQIINSFLETARIENDHFVLQIDTYDVVEILDEAVKDSHDFAKEKKLKIIFKKPSQKIHADIDRVRIREVIDNLIGNAIKYTKSGYVEVGITKNDTHFKIFVKDTGIGIEDKDINKLFQKFSRISPYIAENEDSLVRPGGTGLGLFVSKNIVDEHQGKIWVESKKNSGSTFFFEIPLKKIEMVDNKYIPVDNSKK